MPLVGILIRSFYGAVARQSVQEAETLSDSFSSKPNLFSFITQSKTFALVIDPGLFDQYQYLQ